MAIRIIGVISALLGLFWFIHGLLDLIELVSILSQGYALNSTGLSYESGALAILPVGLLFMYFGIKWAIQGYGKQEPKETSSAENKID